jgi:enoyl-[acyl-carrier protein] reductase I
VIFGVANDRSIAWGITEALHREGARIGLSYAGEVLKKRVLPLAERLNIGFVEQCDVSQDEELDTTFAKIKDTFGTLDVLVHSIAFAGQDELKGEFVPTSRAAFLRTMDISVYSLVALAQRARPLMPNGGSIITMTYYGSEKVMPRYNVMGVAKAALEASVRYLANDLGKDQIRVNAISAGPIKTLAAAGISGFRDMLHFAEASAPLGRLVTPEDIGNTALWLCSHLSTAVTGETVYVDAGYHIMGLPMAALEEQKKPTQ